MWWWCGDSCGGVDIVVVVCRLVVIVVGCGDSCGGVVIVVVVW